jgi:hypothetical protein
LQCIDRCIHDETAKRERERERERERGAKASPLLMKRDQTLGLADLLTNTINKAAIIRQAGARTRLRRY